jgi:alginate O-acetyltransferase complex protein AlgI
MNLNFWIILPLVLLLWVAAWHLQSQKARQALLLVASYLFYSSWGLGFLSVLMASTLLNFGIGSLLRRRPTPALLWLGVVLNVALLGSFKYLPSFLLSGELTFDSGEMLPHIAMPIGISFWTFQGLSYLFDVYREEEVEPSLLEFALFIGFWPTVLAGPVCRLPDMLPQFRIKPEFTSEDLSVGTLRIIQGLLMKMVLAQLLGDGLISGQGVIAGFNEVKAGWGGIDVWLLAIGFGFQLFFDFGGYSNMVIGTARVFGIRLQENFDRPFLSLTPSVFWTRWHMSLSFWIRDYVFLPLAGMRHNSWWPYVVFILAMGLFGLWHEAKATFIVWGVYNGLLLVAHRLGQQLKRRSRFPEFGYAGPVLSWAGTFLLISIGWIFFRANDLDQALTMLQSVVSPTSYYQLALPLSFYFMTLSIICGYFLYHALTSALAQWSAVYKERLANEAEIFLEMRPFESVASVSVIALGIIEFLANRFWWWLTPALLVLTVFIGLAVTNRSSAIAVTPFMYTLF